MSHIDSFKHEIVGNFGRIPVYHPLEEIEGDFICGPGNLLIGGGSGEHPAIVVRNPTAAVAEFLSYELSHYSSEDDVKEYPILKVKAKWLKIIKPHFNLRHNRIIEFCEWHVSTYVNFEEHCRSEGLQNPYDPARHERGFEDWLIVSLGEFIFYAMPQLASEIVSKLHKPYTYFHHITYNNIMVIPPNMPVYSIGGNHFFPKK